MTDWVQHSQSRAPKMNYPLKVQFYRNRMKLLDNYGGTVKNIDYNLSVLLSNAEDNVIYLLNKQYKCTIIQ